MNLVVSDINKIERKATI